MKLDPTIIEDLQRITLQSISWEKLCNKTILISGANGMIASYLVYTLLFLNDMKQLNLRVIGLVRNETKSKKHFSSILLRKDFRLLIQDVTSPVGGENQVDYIIHAASQTSPAAFMNDPVGTIQANILGTINLLDYAKKNDAEFLYLSTREIYGSPVTKMDYVTERDYGVVNPILVRSCYPESKRMSENIIASYREQYGIHAKIVRIAHTYGPGMSVGDGRVLGDFINNFLHHENILLKSKGEVVLALTYISDIVAGIFQTLLDFPDWIYNISKDDEPISVLGLAKYICSLDKMGKMRITIELPKDQKRETGYLQNRVALLDSTKAKKDGWKDTISYKDGIPRLIHLFETMW